MSLRAQISIGPLLLTLVLAAPAVAEVMDKEPTLGEIWTQAAPWIAFAFVAGRLQPLLGTLVFAGFLFTGNAPLVALIEIHDDVGPAIRAEAGWTYIVQAYVANGLVLLSYGLGTVLFVRKRSRKNKPTEVA